MKNAMFYAYGLLRLPLLMLASIGGMLGFWVLIVVLCYYEMPVVFTILSPISNTFTFIFGTHENFRLWGMIALPLYVVSPGIPGRLLRSIEKRTILGTLYRPL